MDPVSRGAGWLVTLAVCSVVALPSRPACTGRPVAMPHVRTPNAHVRELIRDGCRRSPTFRSIFENIERSDLIVYVETTSLAPPHVAAWLQYEGASTVNRILRVFVKVPASDDAMVALIGHELQHATEVAAAPEVRDQRSLEALYRRTGDWNGEGWDSEAARAVTRIVRDEFRMSSDAQRASYHR